VPVLASNASYNPADIGTFEEDPVARGDFETALNNTNEVQLGTTGRVSGHETSRPVWFVRDEDKLYLVPVTGHESQWYKNLLKTPSLRLTADGSDYRATARPITDPDQVDHVVDDFRTKYGARDVAAYYSNPDVAVEVPLG
jgi:deazaflavin-dependent oxidoreductase (nitroreductase family)